jgi:hypothetical protein
MALFSAADRWKANNVSNTISAEGNVCVGTMSPFYDARNRSVA